MTANMLAANGYKVGLYSLSGGTVTNYDTRVISGNCTMVEQGPSSTEHWLFQTYRPAEAPAPTPPVIGVGANRAVGERGTIVGQLVRLNHIDLRAEATAATEPDAVRHEGQHHQPEAHVPRCSWRKPS